MRAATSGRSAPRSHAMRCPGSSTTRSRAPRGTRSWRATPARAAVLTSARWTPGRRRRCCTSRWSRSAGAIRGGPSRRTSCWRWRVRSDRVLGRLRTITADEPRLAPAAPRGAQLQLRRAWPRSGGGLTLEYEHADGIVAGQWVADADPPYDLSRRLGADAVVVEASGETVVLQAHGADRRLPALAGLVAPGARLVSHRAERRATVAKPGAFVKVVPPGRAAALADAHRCASE